MISPGLSAARMVDGAESERWRALACLAWRLQIATAAIGAGAAVFLACLLTREVWRADDAETQLRAIEDARAAILTRPPCDSERAGVVLFREGQTILCDGINWRPAFASTTTTTEWRP